MTNDKILWRGEPSETVVLYWALNSLRTFLIVTIGIVLYSYYETFKTPQAFPVLQQYLPYLITGMIILYISHVVYLSLLRKTYKYSVTHETVDYESGIFNKTFRNVPHHKITDVTKSQNIFERIFGISTLHIQTAGTSIAEISFVGLKDADTPRDIIMESIRLQTTK